VPLKTGIGNLLKVYTLTSRMEMEYGRDYYLHFREKVMMTAMMTKLASSQSRSMSMVAGVFAALSPNNNEKQNWDDVYRMIEAFVKGQDLNAVTVHTYGANKDKAIRILLGESPEQVLTGIKTRSFYYNIMDPWSQMVTIDGHMVAAWQGKRLTMDDAKISREEYSIIQAGVIIAADLVGMLPQQFQSLIWVTWKRIHRILYDPQLKLEFE
jgi:hypothetical protein